MRLPDSSTVYCQIRLAIAGAAILALTAIVVAPLGSLPPQPRLVSVGYPPPRPPTKPWCSDVKRIYQARHVSAAELVRAIEPLLAKEGGTAVFDSQTNKIAVSVDPNLFERIEQVIRFADVRLYVAARPLGDIPQA